MKLKAVVIILVGVMVLSIQNISCMASGIGELSGSQGVGGLSNENMIENSELVLEGEEVVEPEGTMVIEDTIEPEEITETNEIAETEEVINKELGVSTIIGDNEIQTVAEFHVVSGVLVSYSGTVEHVSIPGNLGITTIGAKAFAYNNEIKSVVIPEGVVTIQPEAFRACKSLESVTLPNSLIVLADYAFHSSSKLINIKIPGNVKTIGNAAFGFCTNLVSVVISNGVEVIGDAAFSSCYNLVSVNIPNSVKIIEDSAFSYSNSLVTLTLPNSVSYIGKYAFMGCSLLRNINIPNSVNTIGEFAFAYCQQLRTISIPGSVLNIESSMFLDCSNLQSATIGNGVTSIESTAFLKCKSLSQVSLPETLSIISAFAFSECKSLTSIIIPSNIREIETRAFEDCTSLKSVKFLGDAPKTGNDVFDNTPADLKVYYLARKTGFTDFWCGRTAQVYSSDITKINEFVKRLYERILGRNASSDEINYYADYLIAEYTTGADAGKGFVLSPEFINRKLGNTQYIEILYQTFLGRKSDVAGLKYWNEMLSYGVSRLYVYRGFAESPEYTDICNSYGILRGNVELSEPRDQNLNLTKFISRCYQMALGRTAEADGLNYYAQEMLLERVTPVQASQNFIFSPEFKNKNLSNTDYVKVLYRTFMGREFDQSGLNYHLNRMKNGTSGEEILLGFAYSPEFKEIMKGFGL